MARKITPKMVVAFLKVATVLCFIWPLPKTASRSEVICFKVLRFLSCMNTIVVIVPMIYTLYYVDYDLVTMMKLWCMLGAFTQVFMDIILFALQHDRLRDIISEMEHNFECAEAHEKDIYQRYVDKCVPFYIGATISVFLTAVTISTVTPLVVNQTFPTKTKYPFDENREPFRTIIFMQQFIATWQCFSTVCLGTFIAFLTWFTAARFEILSQKFRAVNGVSEIITCVQQHVKLLRYAQEVVIAIRSVLLVMIIICTWAFIASGLTIISQSTIADKLQFMILLTAAITEVFACAWPADHLIDMTSLKHSRSLCCLGY